VGPSFCCLRSYMEKRRGTGNADQGFAGDRELRKDSLRDAIEATQQVAWRYRISLLSMNSQLHKMWLEAL